MPPVSAASCARRSRRISALALAFESAGALWVDLAAGAARRELVFFLRRAVKRRSPQTISRTRAPHRHPGAGYRQYQAAFRAGTAFAAISLLNWVNFAWISEVTVANSSARA